MYVYIAVYLGFLHLDIEIGLQARRPIHVLQLLQCHSKITLISSESIRQCIIMITWVLVHTLDEEAYVDRPLVIIPASYQDEPSLNPKYPFS